MERIIRFSILFASSLLLILVARGIQSSWFTDNYTIVLGASVIGFVLFLLISIIDLKEEDPIKYDFELVDEIETTGEQKIGTLKISNQGGFIRHFDLPNFRSSYKSEGSETGVPIRIEDKNHSMNSINRNTTREYDVSVQFDPLTDPRRDTDISLQDSVKVTTENHVDGIVENQDINVLLTDN